MPPFPSTPHPVAPPKGLIPATHHNVTAPAGNHSVTVKPPKPATHSTATSTNPGGLPAMQSPQQLQAAANAQAWSSVEQMMKQLPDFNTIDQPYSAQRAAIQPLVDAHRNWLMNAGMYQTKISNGLAQLAQGAGATGDAGVAAGDATAGGPLGASFQGNVSPTALSALPTAIGGSTANYFQGLVPYATALGIGNVGKVNANEQTTLNQVHTDRTGILNQLPGIQAKDFTGLSTAAFNNYKSELAAIAAGGKADAASQTYADKVRHEKVMEGFAQQRLGDASSAASAKTDAAAAKTLAAQTKYDKNLTVKALTDARKVYSNLGGVKTPVTAPTGQGGKYAYKAVIQLVYPKGTQTAPGLPSKSIPIYGSSPKAVQDAIKAYEVANPPKLSPGQTALPTYSNSKGVVKGPSAPSGSGSSSVIKNRPSDYTRRTRAYRTFVSELSQLNSPLSTQAMQELFRRQFGEPVKP